MLDNTARLHQTVVDEAIKEWWRRLHTCVPVKGQHFETFNVTSDYQSTVC